MVILIMGVAGAGKTTIGKLLASQLGWKFVDGDSYHSPGNIAKMAAGMPLTDADRTPWLESLRTAIEGWLRMSERVVLAASVLKQKYRDEVLVDPEVKLVYLRSDRQAIRARLQHRHGHYMNPVLMDSQFDDLEEPENAVTVDAELNPDDIVRDIRNQLSIQ